MSNNNNSGNTTNQGNTASTEAAPVRIVIPTGRLETKSYGGGDKGDNQGSSKPGKR